jgi:hypothetical protein
MALDRLKTSHLIKKIGDILKFSLPHFYAYMKEKIT